MKVKSGGRPKGSGRKLYPPEAREIRKCLIDHDPEQLKLSFPLWTRQAVQLLIQQHFGIEMTPVSAGRYLKAWEFTPQKPVRRAYERNTERVRSGLRKNIRRLLKEPDMNSLGR